MVKNSNGKLSDSSSMITAWKSSRLSHLGDTLTQVDRAVTGLAASPAIAIPESLVITASAYRKFMSKNRLDEVVEGLLAGVNVHSIGELRRPAAQIKGIIHTSPIPEPLFASIYGACRRLGSCRTIVWPVTMPYELFACSREFQDCPRLEATNPEELLGAIKTWWASLFDARAIHFRELRHQSHRDAEITIAAQQVPPPRTEKLLLPFTAAFSTPGMS